MNYRHHFHAGNFADVMKHALLVGLVQALQKKAKGFLFLDTHAGRGRYDLEVAAMGDSLARKPEWPEGIGRLWAREGGPAVLASYLAAVREFDRLARKSHTLHYGEAPHCTVADSASNPLLLSGLQAKPPGGFAFSPHELEANAKKEQRWKFDMMERQSEGEKCGLEGNLTTAPRFYPGSPWLVRMLARPADRMVVCEKHPAECDALRAGFGGVARAEVREADGYAALRALLPPPERRALVLLDPSYEAPDEFARMVVALREGLRRLPSGVLAAWYPLTERARVDEFLAAVRALEPPPCLAAELAIAGESSALKMKGCGLLVLNPPWQFDATARAILSFLAGALAQAPGEGSRVEWIVPPAR